MLRARGAEPVPPKPSRPSFARASRRGRVPSWVLAGLAGAAAIAGGAVAGLFFVLLIVGLLGGVVAGGSFWLRRVPATRQADNTQGPGAGPMERGEETWDVVLLSQNADPADGSPS
jgi:hypothetical protein